MNWYYPALSGVLGTGAALAQLESRAASFAVLGLGCRCVASEPWVTVAESCELAMALLGLGARHLGLGHSRSPAQPPRRGRRLLDGLAVRTECVLAQRAPHLDPGGGDPGVRCERCSLPRPRCADQAVSRLRASAAPADSSPQRSPHRDPKPWPAGRSRTVAVSHPRGSGKTS